MKRAQIMERNRGHWNVEVQLRAAPPQLDRSPMPRMFGVTTRRLRFTRSSSRNDRECATEDAEPVDGTSDRVLRSSQARASSSAKEAPKPSLEICRDVVVSSRTESGQDFLSPELRKSASGTAVAKPQPSLGKDDRGKENVDPLGGSSSGSPLPEWFPRRPLQDITNVLAVGLGEDQQPQPKKKLKKKAGAATAAPSFLPHSDTPTRRRDATITLPKSSSFATPKQFSNLGKNFR